VIEIKDLPEVTKTGPLDMQVCVPEWWADEQIICFAEDTNPCGTTNGWNITKEGSKYLGKSHERVPCAKRNKFVHIMLHA
jgi:hypothetical protein